MQYKKNRQQAYAHIRQYLEKISDITFGMAIVFAVCDFATLTLFTSQYALQSYYLDGGGVGTAAHRQSDSTNPNAECFGAQFCLCSLVLFILYFIGCAASAYSGDKSCV